MDKITLRDHVIATGSHFFDDETMRFFGDTMSNYYLSSSPVNVQSGDGLVLCWKLNRTKAVKHGLKDPAYFACSDFRRVFRREN